MKRKDKRYLYEKYPPSEACNCDICQAYCKRPGWWTVDEAISAVDAGYAGRMMLEMSPEFDFGVLSPAFKGCEKDFAMREYARFGCTFFHDGLCELHGTGFLPLECRFCHHERKGLGAKCHADLEKDWHTEKGRILIKKWLDLVGLYYKYRLTK